MDDEVVYRAVQPEDVVEEARRERQATIVRGEKIDNLSPIVSFCIAKAMNLARDLNHPETTTAHLIVTLTLFPESVDWFSRRQFDAQTAWRSSMNALIDLKRLNVPAKEQPPPSNELKAIVNAAQSIGKSRENQDAVIDDIMCIFKDMKVDEPGRQLIFGRQINTYIEDTLTATRELENVIARGVGELKELIKETGAQTQREIKTLRRRRLIDIFKRTRDN